MPLEPEYPGHAQPAGCIPVGPRTDRVTGRPGPNPPNPNHPAPARWTRPRSSRHRGQILPHPGRGLERVDRSSREPLSRLGGHVRGVSSRGLPTRPVCGMGGCPEQERESSSPHHAKAERTFAVAPRPNPRARRGAGRLADRDDRDVARLSENSQVMGAITPNQPNLAAGVGWHQQKPLISAHRLPHRGSRIQFSDNLSPKQS